MLELCFQPGNPGHELRLNATSHISCRRTDSSLAVSNTCRKATNHGIHPVTQRIHRGCEIVTHGTGKPLNSFHHRLDIFLDARCQQFHEVGHISVCIRQRTFIWHGEVQETSNPCCHRFCCCDHGTGRCPDTCRHLRTDICAPAVCRGSNRTERIKAAPDTCNTGRHRTAQTGHCRRHRGLDAVER